MKFTNLTNPDQCPVEDDQVSIIINDKEVIHYWSYDLFIKLIGHKSDEEFVLITKKEFRGRFTLAEQIVFDNFEHGTGTNEQKAMINTLKQNLFSASYVNLTLQEVDQGLLYLVSLGVITLDRKTEILKVL